jgi:hypothetical protein
MIKSSPNHRLTLDIRPSRIAVPFSLASWRVSMSRCLNSSPKSSLETDLLPIEYDDAPPVSKALIAASIWFNNVAVCDMT